MVDSLLAGWRDVQGVLIWIALGAGVYTAIVGALYARVQRRYPQWTLFIPHPNWASFCGLLGVVILQFFYPTDFSPIMLLLLIVPGLVNIVFTSEKEPFKRKKKLVVPFLLPALILLVLWF